MIRNDYLMRLIEQFTQALAIALGFKKAKEYPKALSVIQNTLRQIFGVDAKFIDTVPEEDLLVLLKVNGAIDPDRTVMIAALQKLSGEIYELQGKEEEAFYAYRKSLTLYLEVLLNGGATMLRDYIPEIDGLTGKLADYNLPYSVNSRLWRYYEKSGKYDKAEDILFELLDDEESGGNIITEGIEFYRRLMAKSDAVLTVGHLPRKEVEEGLATLERLLAENQ